MSKADSLRRRSRRPRLAVETLEARTVLSAATPVPVMDASSTDYDPSTILVRFRPGAVDAVRGGEILANTAVGREVADLLVPGLYEVELGAGVNVRDAVAAYSASPLVEFAEPNFHVYTQDTIPNDPMWNQQTGFVRIHAPLAWDGWQGSGTIMAASIDTGVDYLHPDLWSYNGASFTGTPTSRDDNGHGSHTAGTMAAIGYNGVGVAGVSWANPVLSVKVLSSGGSGQTSWVISGLNYAVAMGARISNNSYGCVGCFSQAFLNALNSANDAGHVFVAAAGNNGANNDTSPFYPANYTAPNVISVGATNSVNDTKASFSNYGRTTVDLFAPGVNVRSTSLNGGYATLSGTSMASPHVAGALTLGIDLLDYHGIFLTPAEYRDWVMATVDPVAGLATQCVSGGRLNVAKLLGMEAFTGRGFDFNPLGETGAFPAASEGGAGFDNAGLVIDTLIGAEVTPAQPNAFDPVAVFSQTPVADASGSELQPAASPQALVSDVVLSLEQATSAEAEPFSNDLFVSL